MSPVWKIVVVISLIGAFIALAQLSAAQLGSYLVGACGKMLDLPGPDLSPYAPKEKPAERWFLPWGLAESVGDRRSIGVMNGQVSHAVS